MPLPPSNPFQDLRLRIQAFLEGGLFEKAITGLILLNALTLGLEASPLPSPELRVLLQAFDRLVLALFVGELLLHGYVHRRRFFQDPWRVFDLLVVLLALIPSAGAFTVLRSMRVLRVLRLVSRVPAMRGVVGALLKALPGMSSIIGLLLLVLYVSAVMATKLFGSISPELFGSLGASLFTLFQVMTVEGWPDIARTVMAQSPHAWVFFVVYLLVATFMVLNLFIAVVVNAMQAQVAEGLKTEGEEQTRLVLEELRAMRRDLEALRVQQGP